MAHGVSVVLLLFSLFWIDAADAQRAPRDARSWLLSVNHGQMTADIDRIPLRLVLEELGRQVPLRLSVNDAWRDHPVLTQALVDPDESVRARAQELVESSNNRAQ